MTAPNPKPDDASETTRRAPAGRARDITWNRPVFHPPFLPNPRIIFDPLPFTTQRLTAVTRQAAH